MTYSGCCQHGIVAIRSLIHSFVGAVWSPAIVGSMSQHKADIYQTPKKAVG